MRDIESKAKGVLKSAFQYIIFGCLLLLSLSLAMESILAVLVLITASVLILPSIRERFIPDSLRHPMFTAILIFIAFVVAVDIRDDAAMAEKERIRQERAETARMEQEKAIADFTANPQPKIEEITYLIDQEMYDMARNYIDALSGSDHEELQALNEKLVQIEEKQQEERRIAEAKAAEEAALNKIEPYAVSDMTPDQYPRIYQQWGTTWVNKLNKMQYEAANKVARSPTCDRVSYVGLSEMRSTPKQSAVFFVDCTNQQRFYVSDKDLAKNVSVQSKQEKTANLTDVQAIQQCIQGVKAHMNYPSTFKSSIFSKSVYRAPGGNVVATVDFEGKNGLGLELPMSARCVFDDTGMGTPEITNR